MFETISPFFAYATALFIAAIIPGPGVAAVVGRALGSSARETLPFIFGLGMGDVVFLSVAVMGLSLVAQTFSEIFLIIKLAGGLYLLWIARSFWTAGIDPQKIEEKRVKSLKGSVLGGFMVTMGNPKTIVFYMALLPNVIDLTDVTMTGFGILCVITMVVLYIALVPYVLLTTRAKNLLSNSGAIQRLNRTASVIIGGAGVFILGEAVWERWLGRPGS